MGRVFGIAIWSIFFVIITGSVTSFVALADDLPDPNPMSEDFFERIGATPEMNKFELKRAFRRSLFLFHEDRTGDKVPHQRINEAWETLVDPVKRAKYLSMRGSGFTPDDFVGLDFGFGNADVFDWRQGYSSDSQFVGDSQDRLNDMREEELINYFLQSSSLDPSDWQDLEFLVQRQDYSEDLRVLARIVLEYPPSLARGILVASIERARSRFGEGMDASTLDSVYKRVRPSKADRHLLEELTVIRDYRPELADTADALIELMELNPLSPLENDNWCVRALSSIRDLIGR